MFLFIVLLLLFVLLDFDSGFWLFGCFVIGLWLVWILLRFTWCLLCCCLVGLCLLICLIVFVFELCGCLVIGLMVLGLFC